MIDDTQKCKGRDQWMPAGDELAHILSEHQLCDHCKLKVAAGLVVDCLEKIDKIEGKASVYRRFGEIVISLGATLLAILGPA